LTALVGVGSGVAFQLLCLHHLARPIHTLANGNRTSAWRLLLATKSLLTTPIPHPHGPTRQRPSPRADDSSGPPCGAAFERTKEVDDVKRTVRKGSSNSGGSGEHVAVSGPVWVVGEAGLAVDVMLREWQGERERERDGEGEGESGRADDARESATTFRLF